MMAATAARRALAVARAGPSGPMSLAAQRAPRAPASADSAHQTAAAFAPAPALRALHWRLVGPFRGGRVVAGSGGPPPPPVFFFGGGGGRGLETPDSRGGPAHPPHRPPRLAFGGGLAL